MRVDALTLEGWRNYQRQQLTFDDGCNVIYGENAQGKTNLLEAIVYLSCGKSPRAHGDRELIGFDRQDALLVGQIFSRQREFVTDIRLSRSTSAPLSPGRSAAEGAGSRIMRTTGPLLSSAAAASYRLCHVSRPTTPSTGSPARACHALTARAVAAPKRPSTVTDGISL